MLGCDGVRWNEGESELRTMLPGCRWQAASYHDIPAVMEGSQSGQYPDLMLILSA